MYRSLLALLILAPVVDAQTSYNAAILDYCKARLGKPVGSGECAHLVSEALRVVGAEFTQFDAKGKQIKDNPQPGDYVWGRLVYRKIIEEGRTTEDKPADLKIQPGDIIQYGAARFANGQVINQHTAVVAAINDKGLPTDVFEQNSADRAGKFRRFVTRGKAPDLSTLKSGRVMVYRAIKATNPLTLQINLTNNATTGPIKYRFAGREFTIGGQNTLGGFRTLVGSGLGIANLIVDGRAYKLKTRSAYEFYQMADGKVGLRETK